MRVTPTTTFLTMDHNLPDIAESALHLEMARNGYQAVLGAVSRLSMPSLLDFLR